MSEMVDRVEKAIHDGLAEYQAEVICRRGGWIDWAAISRAAIAEMREPIEAMIEAGGGACIDYSPREEPLPNAEAGWQAMIDAALKD